MTRFFRLRWFVLLAIVAAGTWFLAGRLLMEFEWTDLDVDSTSVADVRRAITEGGTGPRMKPYPCMANQTTIDLELWLDGPFPVGKGRDIVMEVYVASDALMVDRLYFGPPTRHVLLDALPICLLTSALPSGTDEEAAYGYINVVFTDLENRRYMNFGGEDAFPILLWRLVRVDWNVLPWVMPGTESVSNIMVTPQQ